MSAENRVTSCYLQILVDEAAEPVSSVRAVGVEVLEVCTQNDVEVAWSSDQEVIDDLRTPCLSPRRVCPRRRCELDILGGGRATRQQEQPEHVKEDASDLLDVDQAAGSAAHSVPRVTAGWLGRFLPPPGWLRHSVPPAVARPRRGSTEA